MTLTEFIEARLAEKERHADDFHDRDMCSTLGAIPFPCDCGTPARVLREVEAMRKILAAHSDRPEHRCPLPVLAGPTGQLWTPEEGPCYTLRLLASIWSDHPDYAEAVRP